MTYDSLTLAAVAAELRHAALGRRLGGVVLPDCEQAAIGLPDGGLFVSIRANDPRVHLIDRMPPPTRPAPSLQTHLETILRGALLTGVECVDFDRILRLTVEGVDRIGRAQRHTLVIELMGKHSACCLVDAAGLIAATLKPVTRAVNRHRELLPKVPYVPPPSGGRRDPRQLTRDLLEHLWPNLAAAPSLRDGWRSTFHGASDRLWQAICDAGGLPPDAAGDAPGRADALWRGWHTVAERLADDRYEPCLLRDADGRPALAYPLPLPGAEPLARLSDGLAQVAATRAERLADEQRRGQLRAAARRERERLEARLEGLAKRAERAALADGWQLQADLILANLHRIEPRAERLEVADWPTADGGPTVIELDRAMPPRRQAEKLYERARKARAAAAGVAEERRRIEAELAALDDSNEVPPAPPVAHETKPRTERERWLRKLRTVTSSDGFSIVVGTNAAESEGLLSRVAAPADIWLHVRGAGSGHVIIRTGGRPERVSPATIEQAARLAARHSKMKHSSVVPVVYTLRKYVTKVTGGAAGKVVYRNEKTVFVDPLGS